MTAFIGGQAYPVTLDERLEGAVYLVPAAPECPTCGESMTELHLWYLRWGDIQATCATCLDVVVITD